MESPNKMLRVRTQHPIISIVNGILVDLPAPSNISYFLNFGSLLGLCLTIQLITGNILRLCIIARTLV